MSVIKLTGHLARNANTLVGTDGSAWLFVEIGPDCQGIGAIARQNFGCGHSQQYIADKKARQLRQGARVTVYANGYDICRSPSPHLVLLGVELIEQLDLPNHTETHQVEAAA